MVLEHFPAMACPKFDDGSHVRDRNISPESQANSKTGD
jgi:hypothetical protein